MVKGQRVTSFMQNVYPWLEPVWLKWQNLSETDSVSGAMLCSAPKGTGLSELAKHFAHTLVCSHSTSEPCGFCHSCALTQSGNHPDVHWVVAEKSGKSITVDQVRECNKWAQQSSQLGGKRVIIISPAEAMNESASNALLKTLESPSENCVFLLLTTNKNALLPTIISRCQKWQVAQPDIEQIYLWLKSESDVEINHTGIRLNNYAPLQSLQFFESGQYQHFLTLQQALFDLLAGDSCHYSSIYLLLKDDFLARLNWLAIILSDIQKRHFAIEEIGLCSLSKELMTVVPYQSAYKASTALAELTHQFTIFSGLNQELLLTNWLIELQEDLCS